MRILVADDAPNILFALSRTLTRWGHEVVTAIDGNDAWEKLQSNDDIRLVISDWIMPGMSGPELCQRIRSADLGRYVYVILLTGKDARDDFLEGMDAGADDFVVKPFNRAELKVRLRAGQRIAELERELEARSDRLKTALNELEQDLEAASRVQRDLLPKTSGEFGAVQLEHIFLASAYVSGDSFGYFPLDDRYFAFYSLDVSGHGVPSALLSVAIHELLKPKLLLNEDETPRDPAAVMAELNERFQDNGDLYFTAFLGILDTQTGLVEYCQAGHPPAVFIPDGDARRLLGEGGFPVGIIDLATYESETLQLQPGDRFYLYTDGVMDCVNAASEPYGTDRFLDALNVDVDRSLAESLDSVETDLSQWVGECPFTDDVSILALEFQPALAARGVLAEAVAAVSGVPA